jgi:NADH/NAD ratio-sensing transcriptional regulator Rex
VPVLQLYQLQQQVILLQWAQEEQEVLQHLLDQQVQVQFLQDHQQLQVQEEVKVLEIKINQHLQEMVDPEVQGVAVTKLVLQVIQLE